MLTPFNPVWEILVVDNNNVFFFFLGGGFGTCASVFSFFKLTIHFVFFSLHIINGSHKYIHMYHLLLCLI